MPRAKPLTPIVLLLALLQGVALAESDHAPESAAPGGATETPALRPQPGYGFAPTVGALLRADAEKALAAALGQDAPGAAPAQAPAIKEAPAEQLSLLGIYGRPGAWRADVAINGVSVVLAPGDSFQNWRARSVTSRCAVLVKGGQTRRLCGSR